MPDVVGDNEYRPRMLARKVKRLEAHLAHLVKENATLLDEKDAEIARLKTTLAACGRLCAEVQDWADRLADGDDLTLEECGEFSARCGRIAQAWLPPPTPEELALIDDAIRKARVGDVMGPPKAAQRAARRKKA